MFGHKEGNTGLQSLPDGEAIHHRNRPPFAGVARPHEECSPNKMEPVPSGVPIQDCVSIRSVHCTLVGWLFRVRSVNTVAIEA